MGEGIQGMSGGQGGGMEHGEESPGTVSPPCKTDDDMSPHCHEPSIQSNEFS